jgi:hypothetical protein
MKKSEKQKSEKKYHFPGQKKALTREEWLGTDLTEKGQKNDSTRSK